MSDVLMDLTPEAIEANRRLQESKDNAEYWYQRYVETSRLVQSNQNSVADALRERDQFFVEHVWSYDAGCNDGKRSFLRHCGLNDSLPTTTYTFSYTIDITAPEETIYDLARTINRDINSDYDDSDAGITVTVASYDREYEE